MPASVIVHVDGLRELGEKLRRLGTPGAQKIGNAMTGAGAQVVKKRARRKVESNPSIKTGSLRDALIVKKIPKSQTTLTSEHIVTVRGRGKPRKNSKRKQSIAPHAHFVEFGTVNMPAEPVLRPALDEGRGEATQAMIDRGSKKLAALAK